jgi:hypothetical protein
MDDEGQVLLYRPLFTSAAMSPVLRRAWRRGALLDNAVLPLDARRLQVV